MEITLKPGQTILLLLLVMSGYYEWGNKVLKGRGTPKVDWLVS